jgi:Cu2+-exporting ATPase
MTSTAIQVDDMHCAACIRKVETQLRDLAFVESFSINPVRKLISVTHHASDGDFQLLQSIEALGFAPTLRRQAGASSASNKAQIKRLGIAGICMMQVMTASIGLYFGDAWGMQDSIVTLLTWASLVLCLPIVGYCALPFFASASSAWKRGMNMDVPIALAISLAFGVSVVNTLQGTGHTYYDSVAMFTFLMLASRQIDSSLKRRVSDDDRHFTAAPRTVQRLTADGAQTCAVAALQVGDQVLIAEGQRLPVDGQLLSTRAVLDESNLSGEADWVAKTRGDDLYAGTCNRGAGLECQVSALPQNSRAAQIEALADRITLVKAPLARLADRVAAWFVPSVLLLALATFVGRTLLGAPDAFSAALAVLIVSCPCALALAVPAALTAAMARLRRQGLLLTDSAVLEQIPTITAAYLDKTGTLTLPQLKLQTVEALGQLSESQCLSLAQSLQRHSSHPIARAFFDPMSPALKPALNPTSADWNLNEVVSVPGQGLKATAHLNVSKVPSKVPGKVSGEGAAVPLRIGSAEFCGLPQPNHPNVVYLATATEAPAASEGQALARFTLQMSLRPDTQSAIERLRGYNLDITMLSGDHLANCEPLAEQLGIAFAGEQSPEAKRRHLLARRAAGDRVLFVGDGINDALAFAEAEVGICTLETTDLVRARASGALLTQRLGALADLFDVSFRTRRIVYQNLLWALLYNGIAIPCAMAGLMPPWLAAAGMASSSTLVLLNATRLLTPTSAVVANPKNARGEMH